MRLNLPGNTGKTPATYVSDFKRLRVNTSYTQRYTEANDWRDPLITPKVQSRQRRAAKWLRKFG